ncbi:MAG: type II toxin-antitoxin system RelE/ParE family toxin [Bifidobacteriaceae bacterium]|jgi:hypothetical protein|nr:type II toxin-antitoxin system RelE/ParE family toxin [Bifidobacteriaceae bacterium]
MWRVDLTLIEDWMDGLDQGSRELVVAALEVLAEQGPTLGRPLVDKVKKSRVHNMKELRPGSTGRTEFRALFAFDPKRHAILLVAGDKSANWQRWYRVNLPKAEARYATHLERLAGKKEDQR